MTRDVEVVIYTPQELNQSSYFRAGLFELEQKGLIRCRVKWHTGKHLGRLDTRSGKLVKTNHPQPKTSFYTLIDHSSGNKIDFAVDLYDAPWYFSADALEHCTYIFKRNYVRQYNEPLGDVKKNVHSLGLSFMVQSDFRKRDYTLLGGLWLSNLNVLLKKDRTLVKRFKNSIQQNFHHWQTMMKTRTVSQFEKISDHKQNRVLFQTRCFPKPEEMDARTIHDERAALIRHLKNNLGEKFMGGFVPDPVATRDYNDCLTNLPTEPHEYLKLVQESTIGVYTRGLSYSPAWKMAEYLAQGTCIVAEPLITELPVPLENGKHLLYFSSKEECVDHCRMLLQSPEKRQELSSNARKYYEKNVSPSASALRVLEMMVPKN